MTKEVWTLDILGVSVPNQTKADISAPTVRKPVKRPTLGQIGAAVWGRGFRGPGGPCSKSVTRWSFGFEERSSHSGLFTASGQ